MSGPRNATVLEGGQAQLVCDADGEPDNLTYAWLHSGRLVPWSAEQSRRTTIRNGTLIISNVTKDDSGRYTCRPGNGLLGESEGPEASAYINVTCEYDKELSCC